MSYLLGSYYSVFMFFLCRYVDDTLSIHGCSSILTVLFQTCSRLVPDLFQTRIICLHDCKYLITPPIPFPFQPLPANQPSPSDPNEPRVPLNPYHSSLRATLLACWRFPFHPTGYPPCVLAFRSYIHLIPSATLYPCSHLCA